MKSGTRDKLAKWQMRLDVEFSKGGEEQLTALRSILSVGPRAFYWVLAGTKVSTSFGVLITESILGS